MSPATNPNGKRSDCAGWLSISTDFPAKVEEYDYWVEIPDGTPSRCNPLSAPNYCTPEAIENPTIVYW